MRASSISKSYANTFSFSTFENKYLSNSFHLSEQKFSQEVSSPPILEVTIWDYCFEYQLLSTSFNRISYIFPHLKTFAVEIHMYIQSQGCHLNLMIYRDHATLSSVSYKFSYLEWEYRENTEKFIASDSSLTSSLQQGKFVVTSSLGISLLLYVEEKDFLVSISKVILGLVKDKIVEHFLTLYLFQQIILYIGIGTVSPKNKLNYLFSILKTFVFFV